jgi:hypothetical protein
VTSAEEKHAAHSTSALDAFLRALDERIAAVPLPEIPRTEGQRDAHAPAIEALAREVEQLCTERAVNVRELERWFVEAERAIRANDDEHAREALKRHAEHLRRAQEADAMLSEFRALIAEVRRSLQPNAG